MAALTFIAHKLAGDLPELRQPPYTARIPHPSQIHSRTNRSKEGGGRRGVWEIVWNGALPGFPYPNEAELAPFLGCRYPGTRRGERKALTEAVGCTIFVGQDGQTDILGILIDAVLMSPPTLLRERLHKGLPPPNP